MKAQLGEGLMETFWGKPGPLPHPPPPTPAPLSPCSPDSWAFPQHPAPASPAEEGGPSESSPWGRSACPSPLTALVSPDSCAGKASHPHGLGGRSLGGVPERVQPALPDLCRGHFQGLQA